MTKNNFVHVFWRQWLTLGLQNKPSTPAVEKTLSEGAFVAGTARIPCASSDNFENVSACRFHHCNRSSEAVEIQRYCCNSRSVDEVTLVCLAIISCLAFFQAGSSSVSADELEPGVAAIPVDVEQYFEIMLDKNSTPLISHLAIGTAE
jgi:hypothetical protein